MEKEKCIATVRNSGRPQTNPWVCDLLMSFEAGRPDRSLIDVPQAAELPAVRWRQENLNKLDHDRRKALLDGLGTALP